MNLDDLTLGQIKQIRSLLPLENSQQNLISIPISEDHGYAIVVLDRGFVYVGKVTTGPNWCIIENAKNIRQWGTTEGLGELVLKGKRKDSEIDECGLIKANMRSVISISPLEEKIWKTF